MPKNNKQRNNNAGKWNARMIKGLEDSMNRIGSRIRRSSTFVPTWDGMRDIRDHFEDVDFAIRCNGTLPNEQVAYLESTLDSAYRKLISVQVVPGYVREAMKSGGYSVESDVPNPDYATMKDLLLKYILPANEAEISYRMLTSDDAHMKYNENFVRFIVRFNTLVCRCDQARGTTLGPLTKHEKLNILGTLLLPRLRLKWSEQFSKVKTFEEMITKLKSYEDVCDRSMNASCSAGSDPHRPATSLSSATITGKPSQQIHRSSNTNETFKYWNTNTASGQGFMMGDSTLGLPSSAAFNPNVPSTDTSSGVPTHLKNDWEAFLALRSGQDRSKAAERHVTAEALLKAKTSGTGDHVAFIAASNTGGVDQDRCPYEDCSVKPHWSLGFDPLPLAVVRAANDGEGFNYFCLWCRTDKHAGANCPKTCSRCGGGHRRRDCTVKHSDVTCGYGHKGHTDKTCFMQICGIENPRLPGRKIIRLDPRNRPNPAQHHAKVSFAREAENTTSSHKEGKYSPSLRIARSVDELRQTQIADQQFNAKFHETALASVRMQLEKMDKLQARVEDVLNKDKGQNESASLHALMAEHAKKQEQAVSSLIKQHKRQTADLHNRIKQSKKKQNQNRGRGRSRSRSPERRREYVDRHGNYINRNGEYIHSRDRKRSRESGYGRRR